MHWRRKWQPTPVFLPGKSQGRGSLVGCSMGSHRVGHDCSDLAAADVVERLLNLKVVYGSNKVHCGKSEPENNCQGDSRFNANSASNSLNQSLALSGPWKTDSEDILKNQWIEVPFDTSGEMLIRAFIFLQEKQNKNRSLFSKNPHNSYLMMLRQVSWWAVWQ